MTIKFKLQETLDKRGISRNKLSVEGKIRLATLYEMVNNQSKAIKLETFDAIIKTINRICELENKEKVNVCDIIEYIPDDPDNKNNEK